MINGINNYTKINDNYTKQTTPSANKTENTVENKDNATVNNDVAATYEKSEDVPVKPTKENNADIIAKLKADTQMRTAQLQSLVEKMFNKQGITFSNSDEMYSILRSGKYSVDPEVAAQAKKDISEDGYWGVKQTSDRLVDFAKALANNDPAKADKMIDAIKKGYEKAEKTWGDTLPSICKDTFDTTIKKLEEWRDGLNTTDTTTPDVTEV